MDQKITWAKESLDLGDDVLAIGVLPKNRNVGPNLLDQDIALVCVEQVEHPLNNVVRVLILHHHQQGLDTKREREKQGKKEERGRNG